MNDQRRLRWLYVQLTHLTCGLYGGEEIPLATAIAHIKNPAVEIERAQADFDELSHHITKARSARAIEPVRCGRMTGTCYHAIAAELAWRILRAIERGDDAVLVPCDIHELNRGMELERDAAIALLPTSVPKAKPRRVRSPVKAKIFKLLNKTPSLTNQQLFDKTDAESIGQVRRAKSDWKKAQAQKT